jgi:hypothetical protein
VPVATLTLDVDLEDFLSGYGSDIFAVVPESIRSMGPTGSFGEITCSVLTVHLEDYQQTSSRQRAPAKAAHIPDDWEDEDEDEKTNEEDNRRIWEDAYV